MEGRKQTIQEHPLQIRITLTNKTTKKLEQMEQQAKRHSNYRLLRRLTAIRQLLAGIDVATIAATFGLAEQTIRNWWHAFMIHGVNSLSYKKPPGRPAQLSQSQKRELKQILEASPQEAGYAAACWTSLMIQAVISKRFKVVYSRHYVCALLGQLGFSYQKAKFVSDHLNEEARKVWLGETWPQILAEANRKNALILFGDEATCAMWGSLGYTWAPRGQQPEVKTSGKRKGYKLFGMVEYFTGQFFHQAIQERFNSDSYIAFLRTVLKQTKRPLILIQDGARYHTSTLCQAFFAQESRLTVFQLPAYSPDFNPIEFLWKKLKARATHNHYFDTFEKLMETVDAALDFFASTPTEVLSLMGRYCETLGEVA